MNAIAIQALPSNCADAQRLATRLGLPLREIEVHRFPDNELRVTVGAATSTTILYATFDQPNEKLLAILFASEALGGARRLILIAPYLCYVRQDAAFHPGEAISQRTVGDLLARAVDRVITVDAHLHRTNDIKSVFPGIEADNLSATLAIAPVLSKEGINPATILVGPDAESGRWVGDLAEWLGLAHTVAQKIRRGDRTVDIVLAGSVSLDRRPALLVDDIVSSGATLIAAAKTLQAAGAGPIDAVITHALYPPQLAATFSEAGIRSIRSTSSVPHPTNAIPLDDILTAALERELTGSSRTRGETTS
jgi:ribose-phosphate pyrophosphokinase